MNALYECLLNFSGRNKLQLIVNERVHVNDNPLDMYFK